MPITLHTIAVRVWVLLPVGLVCVVMTACGETGKSTGSRSQRSSSVATTVAADRPPAPGYLTGDYDNDDRRGGQYDDADNDDSTQPKDRDNDSDNTSGSYYDKDDDSALDYGHAASPSEASVITTLVKRYYAAAAADDGRTACSLIVSSFANSVPQYLGRPPGAAYARGNTCAAVVTKVFNAYIQQLRAYATMLHVARVRVEGDQGIAVLGFQTLPGRQIHLAREGGVWKIDALLDSELP